MDLQHAMDAINQYAPNIVKLVLMALGALMVLASTYIAITPSKDDDAWLAGLKEKPLIGPLLKLFTAFSPLDKREGGGLVLSNTAPVPPKEEKPDDKKPA